MGEITRRRTAELLRKLFGFTRDAHDEARTQEKRRITLLDAERLFDPSVEHYAKLEDSARRRMPARPIWFPAPAE